ncbi:MAG: hypothetical protein V3S89_11325, partial [Desulfobacterales bacterium]
GTGDVSRPMLPIKITNPETADSLISYGLIDTGADECAMPAALAPVLGHNLTEGFIKNIMTGNGVTQAYRHTTRIEILDYSDASTVLYTIDDTLVDYMPNLQPILLGANNFLSRFVLTVNYPDGTFSIREPSSLP